MEEFKQILKAAGALVSENAQQTYEDLLQPSAQAAGKVLAFPFEAVNALLDQPRRWIANSNYRLQETNALIANKLKYIEENKLVAPPDFVAVPALQALSYSIDNEMLRDLYANLLAKAMVSDTRNDVHPAYLELIKQFSPLDAKLYKHICSIIAVNNDLQLVNFKVNSNGQTVKEFINIVEYPNEDLSNIAQSVDNFIRCGLIAVTPNAFCESDDEELNQWKNIQDLIKNGYEIDIQSFTPAHITEFGMKFYSICCVE